MFTFTESGYQLLRNRGRSLLLCAVSMLLCGCIAFYLGNISSSQQALDTISETTPAVIRISNFDGDALDDLTIDRTYPDVLQAVWPMRTVYAQCQAAGAYSLENQPLDPKEFSGGDTSILGINCREAVGLHSDEYMTFLEGYDSSFLTGNEALCLVSEDYAQEMGLKPGDEISLPLFLVKYDSMRFPRYVAVWDLIPYPGRYPDPYTLRIVGTFSHKLPVERRVDMYLPVQWLRDTVEALPEKDPQFYPNSWERIPLNFTYTSFSCTLMDSMDLNAFKDSLPDLGFRQPFYLRATGRSDEYDRSAGVSIYMDDRDFIKTAEKLGETIRQYKAFFVPFMAVVVLLVTLCVILVLRGCRRDMAIACSLGRPKLLTGTAHLLAALSAQILGCLLAYPVMVFLAGTAPGTGLLICGAFLCCALLGDLLGLTELLRFDAMGLLTRTD